MKITRYPSSIRIENINEKILEELTKMLSTWDDVYFKYTNEIYSYNENINEIRIPGSFSLYKLKSIGINENDIKDKRTEVVKTRNMSKTLLTSEPRDELQRAAISFLKGNNFSKDSTQKYLSLKTGEGKTYCAINYCVTTKKIPLIFVDQDSLAKQWLKSIIQFTNLKEDNIYYISGQKSIDNLLNMSKKDINKYKFFIVIHRTMKNYITNNIDDLEAGNKLAEKLGIGVKIFDEAHLEMLSMFLADEYIDTESIYLSATPARSDNRENWMYKNAIKEAKMFSSEKGIFKKENYHNVLLVKINSKPTFKETLKFKTKYGFSVNGYASYMEKEEKWDFFYSRIKRLINFSNKNSKKKIAIVVHLLSTVDKLTNELKTEYNDLKINKFDGTIKKEDKMKILNDSDILITTDMSFSKGIDVKDLEVVINLVPISSKPKLEQMLGRLRYIKNKEVWFFDIVDIGIPQINKMMNTKKEIYTKKAKLIKDTTI